MVMGGACFLGSESRQEQRRKLGRSWAGPPPPQIKHQSTFSEERLCTGRCGGFSCNGRNPLTTGLKCLKIRPTGKSTPGQRYDTESQRTCDPEASLCPGGAACCSPKAQGPRGSRHAQPKLGEQAFTLVDQQSS